VERNFSTQKTLERLLARWAGAYLIRMPSLTQLVSFVAALIGIYYILIKAELNRIQVIELFASVFVFVALVNLIMPIYTTLATRNARTRLNEIYKGGPIPKSLSQEECASLAWSEVNALSWRYMFLEAVTAYFLVVLPVVLFMRWVGGVNADQAIYILVGGLVSATAVVLQNFLFLEKALGPVRNVLFDQKFAQEAGRPSFGLRTRFQVIVIALILMVFLFVGMDEFVEGQAELYILSAMLIGMVIYIIRLLEQSVTDPIREIIAVMEKFGKGDYAARVSMLTSDETQQLTGQLNQLLAQLQVSQSALEKEVEQRTADLNIRAARLQAAALISKDAASARDVQTLLARTVRLISERFGFYHAGIFLLDAAGEFAVLQAASSEGGQRMLERGHRLAVGEQGIVGTAAYQNRPHIATDVGQDSVYFKNPDLPLTKSEAAIPLSARGKVIGVLDIQSAEASAFSQDVIELLQTLADQIALAINNAQLIEESQETLAQLQAVLEENIKQIWRRQSMFQKGGYRYTPTGTSILAHKEREAQDTAPDGEKKLLIPITLRGQTIGKLTLTRKTDAAWDEADRALLQEIAVQVGLALENSRLLAEAQQRAFQEQSLSELTSRLGRSIDSDSLLQTIARELHQIPNVAEVSVYLAPEAAPKPETPGGKDIGGS
jgi:GAF domain-containing protein/HAMP domain-containing protein